MSDLGAIFHVKKSGTQYDAHAYTTLDECPYPNIKINFKGQQGYVKLEGKGSGDVPCYVKAKGGVYQVIKEACPTGAIHLGENSDLNFVVPAAVKVLQFVKDSNGKTAFTLGVTPGSTHIFHCRTHHTNIWRTYVKCLTHDVTLYSKAPLKTAFTIKWSPEINNQTPDKTHY